MAYFPISYSYLELLAFSVFRYTPTVLYPAMLIYACYECWFLYVMKGSAIFLMISLVFLSEKSICEEEGFKFDGLGLCVVLLSDCFKMFITCLLVWGIIIDIEK